MQSEKIVGWILILLGIFLILYPLFLSYNIFSGENQPPEIFKIEKEVILPQEKTATSDLAEIEKEMEKILGEKLKELIPTEFITKIMNLTSWSIFVGIMVFGGSQIASIGVKLIKDERKSRHDSPCSSSTAP